MRTKPSRAYDDELQEIGDNLWLTRLRDRDWCPTTLGPKRPRRVWSGRSRLNDGSEAAGAPAGALLPLLEFDSPLADGKERGLADAVGVRLELTPSSFTPEDARGLLDKLAELYSAAAEEGDLRDELRQLIRPVYRNLMELLPGTEGAMSPAFAKGILAGSPLLVHDGRHFRFEPSDRVLYSDRSATRERLGTPEDLWTFVLEAAPVARGPLVTLLNVRILENELTWSPQPGDPALDVAAIADFRAGIRELAPYILARLGAERQDERLVAQDSRRRLREFIDAVVPVTELAVRCRLDEQELGATASRDAFVEIPERHGSRHLSSGVQAHGRRQHPKRLKRSPRHSPTCLR